MVVMQKALWVELCGVAMGLLLAGMRESQAQVPAFPRDPIAGLTQLSQLPLLNRPANESGWPARFQGTVLFANPAKGIMGLRDDTAAAILDYESGGESLRPGERVQIEGVARMVAGRPVIRRAWSLDNDGLHAKQEKQVSLRLKAGPHPLRVDWFNGTQDAVLEVYWEGPGFPRQAVPDSVLFHEELIAAGRPSRRVAGLSYSCYEGYWTQLPNFHALEPVKTGVAANFDISLVTRADNAGLSFRGWLVVPQEGDYTVTLISDDGARLLISDVEQAGGPETIIKRTGRVGALPEPQRLFPGATLPSHDPVQWSSVEGLVTFVDQSQTPATLEISDGGAKIQVEFMAVSHAALALLPQSRIRVTGLTEPRMTPEGRFIAAKLLSSDAQSVELLEAAPRHWSQSALQAVSHLLAHPPRPESVGHLRGRARLTGAGGEFWLQDGAEAVSIRTVQALPQTNEALVEVLGLWSRGSETNRLVLDHAVFRPWIDATNNANHLLVQSLPVLTKIEEVHALSRAEAEKNYPVRVRGVILNHGDGAGMIQDDTRGIYFSGLDATQKVAVGDFVEIEGFSGPGDFAPILMVQRLTRLGQGILPEPARPTWDLLLNGTMDAQRVELKGIVTQVQSNQIALLMVGGELRINTDLAKDDWKPLLNALICLRGCLWAKWNAQTHQVIAGEIRLTDQQIDCLEAPPADLFSAPTNRIADLSLFSLQSSALRRIKVTGQVLRQRDKEGFLADTTNGLRFFLKEPVSFEPGARVEVVGFLELGGPSPVLRAAAARATGFAPLPEPVMPPSDHLLDPGWDARLVQLEARLHSLRSEMDQMVLEVQTGPQMYSVRLPTNSKTRLDLPVGSRLRMTGIYAGVGGSRNSGRDNEDFDLLLNSPQDIVVLERPSWWTMSRLLGAIVVLTTVLLMAGGWVYFLRHQVERRTQELRVEIQERKDLEVERERIHKELLAVSRLAGMAEVATGVLHNVGNVLNSMNVSATLVGEKIRHSKVGSVARVAGLLQEHTADLPTFLVQDERGRQLPGYFKLLAENLAGEQQESLQELRRLQDNVDHIKEIVAMQQNYARVSGVTELVPVRDLVEDALKMHAEAYLRHAVHLTRDYQEVPAIRVDKHKVLQILINLFHNAKYACDESGRTDKEVTVRIATNGNGRVKIEMADNGVGIAPENLARIFAYGFTTRKGGHGFGLHSGALAARELGGALKVRSDGLGQGAVFTLELPMTASPGNSPGP